MVADGLSMHFPVSAGRYGDASDAVLTYEFLSVPLQGGAG